MPLDEPLKFLQAAGEMAECIRGHDWSRHPLGPPAQWPPALQQALRSMLATRHPALVLWGPASFCFYNDGYRDLVGPDRHPSVLGLPGAQAWPESWPRIGAQVQTVLAGGPSTWHENEPVPLLRDGRVQESFWTYSHTPLFDDQAPHGVGGVLVLCANTTAAVQSQQRLAAANSHWARLFENAPAFIAILKGPEHVYEFVNQRYMTFTGRSQFVGRKLADALPETVAQGYARILDEVYATGVAATAHGSEFRASSPDAPHQQQFFDFVFQPIADEHGRTAGIMVMGIDVTSHKRAEAELELSEERLRLAIEAGDIGLWDVDPRSHTLYWPPRVQRLFGITTERPVTLHDFHAGLHPDDRQATLEAFDSAMDPARRSVYDVEYRTVGLDDGVLRWVAARGRGFFNEQGECIRGIGVALDITERKRRESQLHELAATLQQRVSQSLAERKLLADIVDGTAAMVHILDMDFNWLAVNPAGAREFRRAYDVDARVGDNMLAVLSHQPEHQQEVRTMWSRALAGERFTEIAPFGDVNRHRRYYEVHFDALRDEQGRQIGAYQFVYDVTERLHEQERLALAESAVRQSQKMDAIGQLTGGIAHDFNNLLQAISANLELIRRVGRADERVVNYAGKGIEVTRRAARLTSQLLTFSRRQALETRPVPVCDVLLRMHDLLRTTFGPTVALSVDVPAQPLWVMGDRTQLETAVLNLAINARDAMREGGRFQLSVRPVQEPGAGSGLPPGAYVELRAADTGCGMPPEVAAKAFDPFFTTKEVGSGTGLGLSQVYGLATGLGGAARLDSAPARGTTVVLTLPACEPPSDDAADAQADLPPVRRAATLLVVDDEEAVRQVVAESLEAAGYVVLQAGNGHEALALLDSHAVDAALVDFAMPGMSGAVVAREAMAKRPDLPVSLMSGYSDSSAIQQAVGAGVGMLRKPFTLDELEACIGALLQREAAG
ncbi:MAG: PAS domain-containing protein [Aquincola tertiaricarbonis]